MHLQCVSKSWPPNKEDVQGPTDIDHQQAAQTAIPPSHHLILSPQTPRIRQIPLDQQVSAVQMPAHNVKAIRCQLSGNDELEILRGKYIEHSLVGLSETKGQR